MPENASRATVPETVRSVPAADRRAGLGGRKIRCTSACRPPPHAFTRPVCPRTAPACRCLFRVSPVTVPLFRRHPGPAAPYPCLWVGTPAPVALPPSPLRHPASAVLSPLLDPRRPTSSSFDLAVLPSLPSRPVPTTVPSLCRLSLRSALPLPAPIFSPQRPGGTDIFGSSPCRPVRNRDEKRRFPSGGGDGRRRFFDAFFTRGAVSYA